MKTNKNISLSLMLGILLFIPFWATAQTDPPVMMTRPPQAKSLQATNEQLAIKYYTQKEYAKSAALFEALYDENQRQYYYNYLFNCYIYLKEYKQAEKLIRKHKRANPNLFRLDIDHAYVLGLMGNEKKEIKIIEDLIDDLPANKNLVIQIASALQGKGYFEDALLVYEKARQMRENQYSFDIELATAYQYTGEYEKMFDVYLEYLQAYPAEIQTIKNKLQMIIRRDIVDNLSSILKKKLLEKAQSYPDNLVYAELLLWHAMQANDFEMAYRQAKAIDMRFDDNETLLLEVAGVAMSNNQFAIAEQAYGYIRDKKKSSPFYLEAWSGYYAALVEQATANPETETKTFKNIEKTGLKALDELGLNMGTIEIAGRLAHIQAFKLHQYNQAIALLEESIEVPSLRPEIKAWLKLELADILLYQDKVWEATLLYSQIEADMKNEPIGHEAKYRNARLFYYIGEYAWAKTKLDILKSATSKLIANDALELSLFIKDMLAEDTLGFTLRLFSKADLFAYQGNYDSAFVWLRKIEVQSSGIESYQHMIYKNAGYMADVHRYAEADSLYNYLATYYPKSIKADNALFKRATIVQNQFGDPQSALEIYMRLMKDYPESIYAGESRKKYREIREMLGTDVSPAFDFFNEFPDGNEIPADTIN